MTDNACEAGNGTDSTQADSQPQSSEETTSTTTTTTHPDTQEEKPDTQVSLSGSNFSSVFFYFKVIFFLLLVTPFPVLCSEVLYDTGILSNEGTDKVRNIVIFIYVPLRNSNTVHDDNLQIFKKKFLCAMKFMKIIMVAFLGLCPSIHLCVHSIETQIR